MRVRQLGRKEERNRKTKEGEKERFYPREAGRKETEGEEKEERRKEGRVLKRRNHGEVRSKDLGKRKGRVGEGKRGKKDKREIEGREGNTEVKEGRKEKLEGWDKEAGRAEKGWEEEERELRRPGTRALFRAAHLANFTSIQRMFRKSILN